MAEILKIPTHVINADWKDDIGDYQTYGTDEQEKEYISPANISKESINKIKAINLKRGNMVHGIFKQDKITKQEKLAA